MWLNSQRVLLQFRRLEVQILSGLKYFPTTFAMPKYLLRQKHLPKILLRVYPESISGHLANAIEAAVLNADDTGWTTS